MVKFHLTTGVVLIQESKYSQWQNKLHNQLKTRVDDVEDQSYNNGDNEQEGDGTHVKLVAKSDDDDDISVRLSDGGGGGWAAIWG